jgi:hypothetical protein
LIPRQITSSRRAVSDCFAVESLEARRLFAALADAAPGDLVVEPTSLELSAGTGIDTGLFDPNDIRYRIER